METNSICYEVTFELVRCKKTFKKTVKLHISSSVDPISVMYVITKAIEKCGGNFKRITAHRKGVCSKLSLTKDQIFTTVISMCN